MNFVCRANQINCGRVVNQVGKRLQGVVSFTDKQRFWFVYKRILMLLVVTLNQVFHDLESFLELFGSPEVNLLRFVVLDLDLGLFLPLFQKFACVWTILASEALVLDAASELQLELDLLAELVRNLVRLNNLGLNIGLNLENESLLLLFVLLLLSFLLLDSFLLLNALLVAGFFALHFHLLELLCLSSLLLLLNDHLLVLGLFAEHLRSLLLHILVLKLKCALLFQHLLLHFVTLLLLVVFLHVDFLLETALVLEVLLTFLVVSGFVFLLLPFKLLFVLLL